MSYIHLTPWALYNEIDEYAAEWLENLIARGLIAPGIVDRRSIEDIRPDELRGFRQVHFFAGIGVWSYACRRAGISDDTALWTGSCPCQPFSAAGKGEGMADERHLWPAFYHHIRERRPERVYGEQVASKDGLGWLDLVFADMEKAGYAIGAVDTCSAGSGAPHIRQRLRFAAYDLGPAASRLADSETVGRDFRSGLRNSRQDRFGWDVTTDFGSVVGLDYHHHHQGLEGLGNGHRAETGQRQGQVRPVATASGIEWVADSNFDGRDQAGPSLSSTWDDGFIGDGTTIWLADAKGDDHENESKCYEPDFEGRSTEFFSIDDGTDSRTRTRRDTEGSVESGRIGHNPHGFGQGMGRPCPTNGFWSNADWLFCRDGKWRPVEPESFPLVDGSAFGVGSGCPYEGKSRQGMLKAYGNAVDAEATTDFLEAFLEKDTIDLEPNGTIDLAISADMNSTQSGLFEDLLG